MQKNTVVKWTVIGTSCFYAAFSYAQKATPVYELSVHGGTMVYQGDLSGSDIGSLTKLTPAIGISFAKVMDPYFSLRLNLFKGTIADDESKYKGTALPWKTHRNFSFSTKTTELSALVEYRFLGPKVFGGARKLNPYLMAGAGLAFLSNTRSWQNIDLGYFDPKEKTLIGLGIDTVRNVPKAAFVMPVGLGLQYTLGEKWMVRGEGLYRFTPTDYLDGFSQSGNPKAKDKYYSVTFGVSYLLSKNKYACAKNVQ